MGNLFSKLKRVPFPTKIEILSKSNTMKIPGMFVSAWEEDNTGIEAKNLEDPIETFLTAAEEGNGEKVRELLESDPSLIKVRPFFQNFSLKNVALSVFY